MDREDSPGKPRRADEKDHVAVEEKDRYAERITERPEKSAGPAQTKPAAQPDHTQPGDDGVRDGIKPECQIVRKEREEELAGVKHGRHGHSQQRGSAVVPGIPEGPSAGLPLLL